MGEIDRQVYTEFDEALAGIDVEGGDQKIDEGLMAEDPGRRRGILGMVAVVAALALAPVQSLAKIPPEEAKANFEEAKALIVDLLAKLKGLSERLREFVGKLNESKKKIDALEKEMDEIMQKIEKLDFELDSMNAALESDLNLLMAKTGELHECIGKFEEAAKEAVSHPEDESATDRANQLMKKCEELEAEAKPLKLKVDLAQKERQKLSLLIDAEKKNFGIRNDELGHEIEVYDNLSKDAERLSKKSAELGRALQEAKKTFERAYKDYQESVRE